ncbi:MAG: hypothetical protein WCN92_03600 [Eubacteriales bacterium]
MKRNKKRALLSAIAMLLVSAITLSSATFAWFTVGDTASISAITASVKSASAIEVSADNVDWNATLTQANLTYNAVTNNTVKPDNSFPTFLNAISTPATAAMPFFIGTLANTKLFTVTAPATTGEIGASLVKFTFWIRAAADTNVTYAATGFTGITALVSTYCAMQIGTTDANAATIAPLVYVGTTGNTYKAITGTGTGTDANSNGIMDTGEGFTNLAASTVSTQKFLTAPVIALTAGVAREIIVYMWLEGQDAECKVATGGATGDATLALAFEKAP